MKHTCCECGQDRRYSIQCITRQVLLPDAGLTGPGRVPDAGMVAPNTHGCVRKYNFQCLAFSSSSNTARPSRCLYILSYLYCCLVQAYCKPTVKHTCTAGAPPETCEPVTKINSVILKQSAQLLHVAGGGPAKLCHNWKLLGLLMTVIVSKQSSRPFHDAYA